MWGFSQQALGRAAKPRSFAGKLRRDAPVPEKKGGRRARSGPAAGTQQGEARTSCRSEEGSTTGHQTYSGTSLKERRGVCTTASGQRRREPGQGWYSPGGGHMQRKCPDAVGGDSRSTAGIRVRKRRGQGGQAPTTARGNTEKQKCDGKGGTAGGAVAAQAG